MNENQLSNVIKDVLLPENVTLPKTKFIINGGLIGSHLIAKTLLSMVELED